MPESEVEKIKEEIQMLREQHAHVLELFKSEVDNTSKHIERIYNHIADIHEFLNPVVDKVFPGYARGKLQIAQVLGTNRPPEPKGKSE